MRRNRETGLVANEVRLLLLAAALFQAGTETFHGYALSTELEAAEAEGRSIGRSMSYSTIYRCLDRLEQLGLLTGEWSTEELRGPPRRLYRLTPDGFELAADLADRPDTRSLGWRAT